MEPRFYNEVSDVKLRRHIRWANQRARSLLQKAKSSHYKHLFYSSLGINAQDMGPAIASHIFKVQWNVAHYWKKKH